MRVLRIIRSVDLRGGGPIEGIHQISPLCAELGVTSELLSLDAPLSQPVGSSDYPVHRLGTGGVGYGYSPKLVPWLKANASRFDAYIIHGLWQYHAVGAWCVLHGLKVPYYVYPHGMLDPWFKRAYPLKHLKKCLYWPWADYRVLRDARAVLFTSEEERRVSSQSFWPYRARELVVNYGTAGLVGDGDVQRRRFLRQFPQLDGRRCLLFLGRIHPKKGVDLLIRAFAALLRQQPVQSCNLPHLILAGPHDHAYGQEMQRLAGRVGLGTDVLTWAGMVHGDLKWGAFRAAEAFVLPSHQENFGIAVAESLSAGVPVLLGKGVNIWPEIVQDGAGFAEADTFEGTLALLKKWEQLGASARAGMRARARECFHRRFHIRRAAESLCSVLNGRSSLRGD